MALLPLLLGLARAEPALQADLHLDTPTQLHRRRTGLDGEGLEAGLAQLRAGGTTLAVEVLWPPRDADWPAHVDGLLARLEAEDRRLDGVERVDHPAAARAAAAAGRVGMVYALEGAHGLGEPGADHGVRALRRLHARGLTVLGLTWSFSNPWAGSSGDGGGGLTDAGRALVAEAHRLGVLVDLSHASRTTTLEVCRSAPVPVLASHSDAHAITPHARNLTDEEIRCIAATGGVIGVNLHAPFVGAPATVAKVADHLDHFVAVGGPGVVALGTDYDGLITPAAGLPDAGALPALFAELRRRGWSEAQVDGLRGDNFLRAWEAATAWADRAEALGPAPRSRR